ncbi:MAG: hypothetical protein IPF77_16665 [Gemmatimonadetes bacterium]|nr:hypothetical protein [Gemmatimonadota bacterium]
MTQPSREFLDFQAAVAGEYSLERELGRGGMGIVYLARDVHLDRDVAIKVLPAQLAESGAFRERFPREARTAAGLSHPHIVPIHPVGRQGRLRLLRDELRGRQDRPARGCAPAGRCRRPRRRGCCARWRGRWRTRMAAASCTAT